MQRLPELIQPISPMSPSVEFATLDSRLYDVTPWDDVVVQISPGNGGAWPASAVVTVDASDARGPFDAISSGAVTFTAFGLVRIKVKGYQTIRIRTSTISAASAATYRIRVRGTSDAS